MPCTAMSVVTVIEPVLLRSICETCADPETSVIREVLDADLVMRVLRRVKLRGRIFSKKGRRCGQHATMIPVLIWAIAHIRVVPILYVTSPWYATSASESTRRPPMIMLLHRY
jgi:hypothetical protein